MVSPARRIVGTLIGLTLFAGCGTAPGPAAPQATMRAKGQSHILVTIESFAPGRATPFGGKVPMPRLAALAQRGIVYDDAVSPSPLARPALTALLTGVSPDRSGVRDNIHDAVPLGLPTLAELAKAAGLEPVAFIGSAFASYTSGLQRGFTLFDGPEETVVGPAQHAPPVTSAVDIATHVAAWLKARPADAPAFVWIHFADLGSLSIPVPKPTTDSSVVDRGDVKAYDAALEAIDVALGTIEDAVKAQPGLAATDWTIAGTHGAYLGEGGRFGEGFWLSNETLRVPLVRVGGTIPSSKRDARPTWLPDVAATLAAAMGGKLDTTSDGVPLDTAPPAGRQRLAWNYATDDQLAWPPETAVRSGGGFAELDAAGARSAKPRVRTLAAADKAAIERQGLAVGSPRTSPVPKDRDAWLLDLQVARRYLAGDRPILAGQKAKKMLEASPDALSALVLRAYFYAVNPRKEGAAIKTALLARYANRSDALHWAAHLALADKQREAAAALFEAAVKVGPVEPEMYYDLACAHALTGQSQAALSDLRHALDAGYRNWDWVDKDPDLASLRGDPGFLELVRAHGR